MAAGSLEDLRAMIAGDSACSLAPEAYTWYRTLESEQTLRGRSIVGNGACVRLVQDRTGAPAASFWRKGPKVKGNAAVPAGAAIAAGWTTQGLYPSNPSGNHAAIYLRTERDGLLVVDQWQGIHLSDFPTHKLRWGATRNWPSNDGDAYYVILTQSLHQSSPGHRSE
jgi:hypothetical protein